MNRILIPIKPKYSNGILDGFKKFEMRRKVPKSKVDEILIYETSPTSKIVGKFKVKEMHRENLEMLWKMTKDSNMLSKEEFDLYYNDLELGHAFEVCEPERFKKPLDLKDFSLTHPPQGFVYVKEIQKNA